MAHSELTADAAASILATFDIIIAPHALELERREHRWLVGLPGDRIAWIAASDRGRAMLERERRMLRLLRGHLPVDVPVVVAEADDGTADVRTLIPGRVDPGWVHRRVVADGSFASMLGHEVGTALASLHALVPDRDVKTSLPTEPEWPTPVPVVMERLRRVIDDEVIHAGAETVLGMYADVVACIKPDERVLCHGDLGFHNLVLASDSHALRGIFDWEAACWSDPHLDFRYLLADLEHTALFEAAVASYAACGGTPIQHRRAVLYNAVWAVSFLAFRDGVSPEMRWCGRTRAEDLAWTRRALSLSIE